MKSLVMLAVGMVAFGAAAADHPTTGMLYNQQEDSSLTYTCTLQQGQQRLRCDFIQTAVREKAKPVDLEKKLAEARKNYPGAVKEFSDPQQCGKVGAWAGRLFVADLPIDFLDRRFRTLKPARDWGRTLHFSTMRTREVTERCY